MTRPRTVLTVVSVLLSLVLASCSLHVPTDPNDTLERVRGGVLSVGVSPYPPWTIVEPGQEPSGVEPEAVRAFAERIDAEIAWETGGETELMPLLQNNELDLVIGGLESSTPWSNEVGLTRTYLTTVNAEGKQIQHVMAVQNGENHFLFELEDYLNHTDIQVPESVQVKK